MDPGVFCVSKATTVSDQFTISRIPPVSNSALELNTAFLVRYPLTTDNYTIGGRRKDGICLLLFPNGAAIMLCNHGLRLVLLVCGYEGLWMLVSVVSHSKGCHVGRPSDLHVNIASTLTMLWDHIFILWTSRKPLFLKVMRRTKFQQFTGARLDGHIDKGW